MAFGIDRGELGRWKETVRRGEIAFLTHYWLDERFPFMRTVTKAGCADRDRLVRWGERYGLDPRFIHSRAEFPHYDLFGAKQIEVLEKEGLMEHLERFGLGGQGVYANMSQEERQE
ncbi:hypothetical protein [Paenibacillus sp. HB172176]|uniref:hypothetical protein n=1 Tax=Paenibacillus sp. HB172176 TaxID=2493690 RepID=UPI001438A145|nr:hypothetical protein [Paenibacillus sp. HB172176]